MRNGDEDEDEVEDEDEKWSALLSYSGIRDESES